MAESPPLTRGGQQRLEITRVDYGGALEASDEVAREDALQLTVDGQPLAILLRTPGADLELALGLLHAEGIVGSMADVSFVRLAPSGQLVMPNTGSDVRLDPQSENLVDVHLRSPLPKGGLGWQRNLPSSSACGLCGTATLEALGRFQPPVQGDRLWTPARIFALTGMLSRAQLVFTATGGLHAAGLLAFDGDDMAVAEDVGRHNAVDKLVGQAMLRGLLPLTNACLVVSGRAGFEIIQKAAKAQIAVVASISAPSTMAVHAARALGVTLIGFLRGETCNVYSRPDRLGFPQDAGAAGDQGPA